MSGKVIQASKSMVEPSLFFTMPRGGMTRYLADVEKGLRGSGPGAFGS